MRSDTAMTGEITLSGLVFPVGGIKEKVLSAYRAGIRRIILPAQNEAEIEEIPEEVRKQIDFTLATRVSDVLNAALEKERTAPEGTNFVLPGADTRRDTGEALIAKKK